MNDNLDILEVMLFIAVPLIVWLLCSGSNEVKESTYNPTRCKVHKWEIINEIMICSVCNFAPVLEEKINNLFDKKNDEWE